MEKKTIVRICGHTEEILMDYYKNLTKKQIKELISEKESEVCDACWYAENEGEDDPSYYEEF